MNGVNFTYVGKGVIASDTLYYRAHTAARELREGDVDWDALFGAEGVRVFSTGGIYTLISPTSAGLAIEGVQEGQRARHLRRRRPELPVEGRAEQGTRPRNQPDHRAATSASSSATTPT